MHEEGEEETQNRSFKNCEAFCNRLRRNNPGLYQQGHVKVLVRQLVALIRDYQRNGQQIHYYHGEMRKLFADQASVIDDVNKLFCSEAKIKTQDPVQQLQASFRNDPEKLRIMQETAQLIQQGHLDPAQQFDVVIINISQLLKIQFRDSPEALHEIENVFRHKKNPKIQIDWKDYPPKNNKRVKVDHQPRIQEEYQAVLYYSQYFHNNLSVLQQNREIKNEITMFDRLRTHVFSHFQLEEHCRHFFKEFINVLLLYTECIITPHEFLELVSQHTFLAPVMDELRNAINSRAHARRQQTTLFKPLKDTDFKNAEHVTGSYVRMHPGYANIIRNVVPGVLNHIWVSVPFGSEDYSFSIMRKNSFEEQLFKIEDEMYEYDVNINCYRATIKLLEKIENGTHTEEQLRALMNKVMQIKCLQQVYKTNARDQEEVITLWQKSPIACSTILRERLECKCNELIRSREIAVERSWKLTQKNNFSRSLDHRSFYFKKNEKQYTCVTRFLKEAEERYRTPQAEYLNSLQHLTTIKPLSHGQVNHQFVDSTFSLYLPNRNLIRETFDVFRQHAQDNEAVLRFLQQMSEGFFKIAFETEVYEFSYLRSELQEIEPYLGCVASLDSLQLELEQKTKTLNAQVQEISESEFELDRLRSLDSPDVQEEQMYPQSRFEEVENQASTIYATQGMYVFLRYFYTLYQRLEIARQVSEIFESSDRVAKLTTFEKAELAQKRYRLFKLALLYQIKNKEFKYQDYLSILFGKQAFLFYTIDKLLSDCLKCLRDMCKDIVTENYMDFLFNETESRQFKLDPTHSLEQQLAMLSYSLLDKDSERVIFKVPKVIYQQFELMENSLLISYLPNCSNITDRNQITRINQFIKQYTSTFPQHKLKVYLQRNLRKTPQQSKNQLEWLLSDQLKLRLYQGDADVIY